MKMVSSQNAFDQPSGNAHRGRCPHIGNVTLFDTTLRDGEQAPGIALSQEDKLTLAKAIDDLGVDSMEVGFAASGETEKETIAKIVSSGLRAKIYSLARCKINDIDAAAECGVRYIHLFIATSDIHLEHKLRISREEMLSKIRGSVSYAKSKGMFVQFSCEDATRTEMNDLREAYRTAVESGADMINVPDTVGITTPDEMYDLIKELKSCIEVPIAVHCHNDLGLAVANSLEAIYAGAEQVHVCVNGIGERSGNASMEELAVCLLLKHNIRVMDTGKIASISRMVSRYTGYSVAYNKPVVGRNAFAHESGIHVHGMINDPATYEAYPPEIVGRSHTFSLGKHSGEHSIRNRLDMMNVDFPEELMDKLLANVKSIAISGKEITDLELALIAENIIWNGKVNDRVVLREFTVMTGKNCVPTASVTIDVDGKPIARADIGNGPADAAFNAIRGVFNNRYEIADFRVEAITGGSNALCEATVMIRDTLSNGKISVGKYVGTDIISTSVEAVMEAIARNY